MSAKYELTSRVCVYAGVTYYRIRALKSFSDVKKGDWGGLVVGPDCLSQEGNCWIYGNARCGVGSIIVGHATARENSAVERGAMMAGYGDISGTVRVWDTNASVAGNAKVSGGLLVYIRILGHAKVKGAGPIKFSGINNEISGNADVSLLSAGVQNIQITGNVKITGAPSMVGVYLTGNAVIGGTPVIQVLKTVGSPTIKDEAQVRNCELGGTVKIHGQANIQDEILMGEEDIS